MRRSLQFLLAFLIAAMAAFGQVRYVILVTIDGGAAFHLDNKELELPNIRELIAKGAWADGGSETVFPSVTHPSHTTLITGVFPQKHGVLANDTVMNAAGDVLPGNSMPRSKIILTKTIFDTAKQKGLTTAAFMWPETVEDPSIDYNLIDRAEPGASERRLVRNAFTVELEKDRIPVNLFDRFRKEGNWSGMSDAITAMAACDVIRKHKPNLLAIHLVNTDHEQHDRGPDSYIAKAELTKVDNYIGQMIAALKDAGIYDQTTFFIGADHGFASTYHEMNIRPFFAEAGIENKVRLYGNTWAPFLRVLPSFDSKVDQPKLDRVLDRLRKNLRITRIYKSDEYPDALRIPRFEESDRVRGQYLIVADLDTHLVWTADSDTSWRKRSKPAYGHGYLPFQPAMYPMLVVSGNGIRKGVKIGHVHNADVAPTISVLLGLAPLDFDGKPLAQALEH